MKKVVVYDVPRASNINDNWVYPCCGLFKLEKWEAYYHSYADIIQLYIRQLLESETSFCDICHKNCTSPADFVLHQERVHLCLPLFVCPVCHFNYITRSCLHMHITESHGGPETAISLIYDLEIVFVMLLCNFHDVIPFLYCCQLTILAGISSIRLIIVQGSSYNLLIYGFSHTCFDNDIYQFLLCVFKQRLHLSV